MTQNEKDLLLKDLCARLPYGVAVKFKVNEVIENNEKFIYNIDGEYSYITNGKSYLTLDIIKMLFNNYLDEIKPYLFPMSSMTEEQKVEFEKMSELDYDYIITQVKNDVPNWTSGLNRFNWLIKNHFDVYGLIPMGLAIDATELNIY